MELPVESRLLRVFVGEAEKHDGRPTYEAIVLKAREMNLAGATVLRGIMGYGRTSRVHAAKVLEMSGDLPVVIEIVDCEERIELFLPILDQMLRGGLVTLEKVQIIHYRHE